MQIPVVGLSFGSENFLQRLAKLLNKDFRKLRFYYKGTKKIPKDAWNKFREQYQAERVLDHFRDEGVKLWVTEKGIYGKGTNYVFGETEYRGPVLVSTNRLKPEFYDQEPDAELLMERLRKESVHELGHCFGLDHCDNAECVMRYSSSIKAVDQKEGDFCEECEVKISTEGLPLG